jgi:hypothetical protein
VQGIGMAGRSADHLAIQAVGFREVALFVKAARLDEQGGELAVVLWVSSATVNRGPPARNVTKSTSPYHGYPQRARGLVSAPLTMLTDGRTLSFAVRV